MLNSNDFRNLNVGVVDQDPGYNFNLQSIRNVRSFDSLSDCLYSLTESKLSICLFVRDDGRGLHQIEIYIDNTKKIIELYGKQFVLENIVKEQAEILEQTSETIDSKMTLYSSSIAKARYELVNASRELDEQEAQLVSYQADLANMKRDFNEVYVPLKNMQPEIKSLQSDLRKNRETLLSNISYFRAKKQSIDNQISSLQSFLSGKLIPQDYNFVSSGLNSISNDLNQIDQSLSDIERTQSDNRLINIIDSLDSVIIKLDNVKVTLDKLDVGLSNSIQKTRQSGDRIDYFISKLDEANNEMDSFSKSAGGNMVTADFKKAFQTSEDPVFLAFPLLISIIITFTSLVLSNMFILNQVNKPSYFRDIISPTKDVNFIFANYLVNLFFVFVQAAVLFIIGISWFGMPFSNIGMFVIAIFFTSSIFILVGMSLGYLIKSQSVSMLVTIFFVMLMLIMSDLISPAILSGKSMQFFISLNPFVILHKILTDSLILQKPMQYILPHITRLASLLGIIILITYLSKKVSEEDAIQ